MNNDQNKSNTGEQIKGALSEALKTGDFRELNIMLSDTVVNALNEVGRYINIEGSTQTKTQASAQSYSETTQETSTNIPVWQQRALEREKQKEEKRQQQLQQTQLQPRTPSLPSIKIHKVGNVSNVLYKVFGGIGLGITGFATLIHFLVFLTANETTVGGWITNFIFLAIFYGMISVGINQKRRLKRAQRYVQLCDYRVYGEIEHLAKATGKPKRYVIKDLQKMLALGIFPEGHLDEQNTCFMLNDVVYRQYLETEKARGQRERETAALPAPQPVLEVSEEEESELNTMVAEGMEFIRKLRDLNDKIPSEVISAKLFLLENLLKDIFDSVREHPEQMNRMHKLMNYYLPTTLKLVEAYEEFDRVSSPGEDIVAAKAEIENTLDTINQAFTELLNNLFQDAVFDATTDAQVLKSMLAREGLMKEMAFANVEKQ